MRISTSVSFCLHTVKHHCKLKLGSCFLLSFNVRIYSCLSLFCHIGQMYRSFYIFCFSAAVHMNNLNDPQDWNIRPERQGDGAGDSSKWNYALLVPMLGLAAFRMYCVPVAQW